MEWKDLYLYLCTILLLLLLFNWKNYFRSIYLALFCLKGPPAVPILGNVLLIRDNRHLVELATNISELYGPIIRIWVSVLPCFFITEPSHLQVILSSSKFSNRSFFYSYLHNFLGPGLVSNSGDKWRINRKLIQPYFNNKTLEIFFETFSKSSMILIENLENQEDINVVKLLNKISLNILQEVTLGIPVCVEDLPYRKGRMLLPARIAKPWLLLDFVFKITKASKAESKQKATLQEYTKKILEEKKRQFQESHGENTCLLEMFLEISQNNSTFGEEDVVNELSTFMLAGQDTVSAGIAFSLYFIAKHQEVQEKIVAELDEIFENSDRMLVFEDLVNMKYLEQCIKESLRLCPSVPILSRKLPEDVLFGKLTLPAGSTILMSPFVTHRLPHVFHDPLKYDPERFSADNLSKIHPFGYIPFSSGPRNCIGYKFALIEMKTVIANILRNYNLTLTPGHEMLNLAYAVTLKAKGGIWIRLKKRFKHKESSRSPKSLFNYKQ